MSRNHPQRVYSKKDSPTFIHTNMNNVVLFTNWTDKKFGFPEDENAKWNSEPFSIEPGESKWLEDFKAHKFAKNIAERELYRQNKPLIPVVIEELKAKCFIKSIELGSSVTAAEAIAEQVEEEPQKKTKKKKEVKAEEEFEGLQDNV
jgi:hypothetical protein